ncbi:unnamed protein product, partial [Prorocentrum cordatum]
MATPAGVGGGTASQAAPPPPPAAMHVARPSSPSAPSGVPPWLQDPEPAADAAAGLSALPMSFKSETSLMVAAAGLQEPCALTPSSAASCARAPPLVPEAEACGAPAEAARPRASTKELPCRKDVMDSMAASQATKDPLRFSSEPSRRTTSASSKSTTLPLLQTPKQLKLGAAHSVGNHLAALDAQKAHEGDGPTQSRATATFEALRRHPSVLRGPRPGANVSDGRNGDVFADIGAQVA